MLHMAVCVSKGALRGRGGAWFQAALHSLKAQRAALALSEAAVLPEALLIVAVHRAGGAGALHLGMMRVDAAGPLGRPLDARLASSSSSSINGGGINGGQSPSPSDREATARRFNNFVRAAYILSLCVLMSSWACVWLPVGMVAGVTGLVAASIARTNLRNLLTVVQHRQSARLRSAPARPLCPPRARLAAQGSVVLPE